MRPVETTPAVPPVPGVWRLGWLLFMQPIKLHGMFKAWGMERDPSLLKLWPRVKGGDPVVRVLLVRWTVWLFVLMPVATVLARAALWAALGVPFSWPDMAFGVAVGVAFGAAVGAAVGVAVGVTAGVAVGVAVGAAYGVAFVVVYGVTVGVTQRVAVGAAIGMAVSMVYGAAYGVVYDPSYGVAVGAAVLMMSFRLPVWLAETFGTLFLSGCSRLRAGAAVRLYRYLPFQHHDLIYLPLPGLRSFLLRLAEADPALGKQVIAEAAASTGQKRPARLALVELQARDLERAATGRLFARAADLDFPFLPKPDSNGEDQTLFSMFAFQSAARDLVAGGTNQRHRRLALDRAHKKLESFRTTTALTRNPEPLARRLLPTAALWLDVIREEQHKLFLEPQEIPTAFIAGSPLVPDDPENRPLFRGRDDVMKLIAHDLAPDRRGVLFVFGQRRMGKSSLGNYLPTFLGTGTRVLQVDFQSLAGDPRRATPHRIIVAAIAAALSPDAPPPDSPHWTDALRYLKELDKTLGDRTVLVVIDEVERVEDGIRAGWCTPDVLDLLRAAGDALRRIRFLLLAAYPLYRLGPHWVDRLISVTSRTLSYLDAPDARALMVEPIPEFPAIYPEGGVDRILAMTGRHPYLLQKVGDELCRLLNAGRRHQATLEDLERVFDSVVTGADLFDELWDKRTPEERASLQRMAAADAPVAPDAAALSLLREGYVEKVDGKTAIAVPLFRAWIVGTKGAVPAVPPAPPDGKTDG